MSAKTILIATGIVVSAVAAIAHFIFEQRRYLTNNPNATGDNFRTHIDPNCPICLETLEPNSPSVCLLPCGHYLHDDCLKAMNRNRGIYDTNKCPTCRTPFRFE